MNDFGSFIKSIRTKRKLTLVELSILTGVSNPYLSQIENNKFEPSLEVLNKLSVGLNQPLDSLIKGVGYSLQSDSVGEESKDIRLIRHFLKGIETKLGVYSEQIKELESKKHKLYRQQNGLLNDLNKKTGGIIK